jgi:hypothetical protein
MFTFMDQFQRWVFHLAATTWHRARRSKARAISATNRLFYGDWSSRKSFDGDRDPFGRSFYFIRKSGTKGH